jgi:hypothetical protein
MSSTETLASLETRLNAAMKAKIEKLGLTPEPESFSDHETTYDSMGTPTVGLSCIVEVAADRNAVVEALAEYGFRLVLESEENWDSMLTSVVCDAKAKTRKKIVDELKSKRGAVCL